MNKILNMPPNEIRVELLRSRVTQIGLARSLKVTPQAIYQVIQGNAVSHRIREEIARALNKDLKIIWPSTYLYGGGPKKPGRPSGDKSTKNPQCLN